MKNMMAKRIHVTIAQDPVVQIRMSACVVMRDEKMKGKTNSPATAHVVITDATNGETGKYDSRKPNNDGQTLDIPHPKSAIPVMNRPMLM